MSEVIDLRDQPGRRVSRRPVRLAYQPGLDGLRGLAVAGVLAFHGGFTWAIGGYLGVSTFFTLSGFLITSLLVVERESRGRIALGAFWARRFRRLMPAALLTLAGAALFGFTIAEGEQLRDLPADLLAALAYVANWRFIADDQSYAELFAEPSPVLHFWSLAIEEQFYLLFPLVATGCLALARGSRNVLMVLAGVAALGSTVLMATRHVPGLDTTAVYYSTFTRAAELLVGVLLALALAGRGPLRGLPARLAAIGGVLVLAVSLWWWSTVDQSTAWLYEGGFTIYALMSGLLVVAATVPGPVRAVLSLPPLRDLGRISYGVYLFHWPIFLWLSPDRTGLDPVPLFALRCSVTLIVALISYRWVEEPIRRERALVDWRRYVVPPAAVGAVVAAIVALVVLVPDSRRDDFATALEEAPEAQSPAAALDAASGTGGPEAEPSTVPSLDRVLLMGDSVMAQAYDRFDDAFARRGITTGYAGGPGTGPLFPQGDWLSQLDGWITDFDPDAIVIEACCNYTTPPEQLYVDGTGAPVEPNTEAAFAAWDRESRALIDRAAAAGVTVLWVLPPPVQTNGFYGPMEAHVERLDEMYRGYPDELAVVALDWRTPLTENGAYTDEIIDDSGVPVRVRVADGVHMTDAGSELLAEVTIDRLEELASYPVL